MIQNHNSWSVCISSDFELNFLIYVASTYGLLKEDINENILWPSRQMVESDELHQKLEIQWKWFWDRSINQKAHKNNNHVSFVLGLPDFELVEQHELREVLVHLWPSFRQWWYMPAGGQAAMNYWEGIPDLIRYVQEFEDEVGRKIKPFHLNVDLIYNGPNELIEVTEEYIIMPIKVEYLMKRDWWMSRFTERY
ncbi:MULTISPECIES: hypothetical protein [unclassified Paenibacillus]|uniref:hypothetical protein n=1 Tax=unclassified Paenibacillus TaxID=185978 RepID=UPI0007BF6EBC|nr:MULTISPECIES: hypothetical protein [unclassified Paenibacillus]SEB10796.1 hypothetical protein SAMN03159332_3566 [Paenibacillus sp. 276b]